MTDKPKYNYASYKFKEFDDIFRPAAVLDYDWVFRGHADSSWNISSSLEREVMRHGHRIPVMADIEEISLECIKQIPSLRSEHGLNTDDGFSWLALLQHHGCKTRLVDFTESFYIALYFAVKEMRKSKNTNIDTAVWAISTLQLDTNVRNSNFIDDNRFSEQESKERMVNNAVSKTGRYFDSNEIHVICSKPKELNERLIAQQGLFLCPLTIMRDFMDTLTQSLKLTGKEEEVLWLDTIDDLKNATGQVDVIKFIIPGELICDVLFHLKKMNITEATLFPGLDGFARSLNYFATGMG